MEFSERLKELRSEKGISQAKLAADIHISRSAVAKWENGLGLPSDESLKMLAEYFGVGVGELQLRRDTAQGYHRCVNGHAAHAVVGDRDGDGIDGGIVGHAGLGTDLLTDTVGVGANLVEAQFGKGEGAVGGILHGADDVAGFVQYIGVGSGNPGCPGQCDLHLAKIGAAKENIDDRHNDVVGQALGDGGECTADDSTNSQCHGVALDGKFLKFGPPAGFLNFYILFTHKCVLLCLFLVYITLLGC